MDQRRQELPKALENQGFRYFWRLLAIPVNR